MNNLVFSLDIGTRSVIGTVGVIKDKKLNIIAEAMVEHEERAMLDGQIHDISLVAKAVEKVKRQLEENINEPLTNVAIAAAGRFLRTVEVKVEIESEEEKEIDKETVRGLELTAVKKAEDKVMENMEGKLYCVGYSVKNYYLNSYVISNLISHKGNSIGAEVIATFLPRSVVDSLYAVIKKVNLTVHSLTLEPIAALEAAVPQKLRLLNLALVDIGAGTSDIAITSNNTISAFGMVSNAGDEITEIIAKQYLIDFNTAEKIKRQLEFQEEIAIVDILGFETLISREEIYKVIAPGVNKLSEDISSKILELNGGKAPNAVFLVGGGAHTPMLKELLCEKLNLPPQRIGIRGRETIEECVGADLSLGSTGVTVIGIALDSLKKSGNDFIDVILNDNVVSLFNYKENTVMDAILQAGLSPKVIMAKKGANLRFTLNDTPRIAFGGNGKNAVIKINGNIATIDSKIREGDIIEIDFAKDGEKAKPKILDYIKNFQSISFYFNERIYYLDPIVEKNGEKASYEEEINQGDSIKIIYSSTLGDFKRYILKNDIDLYDYYCNNKLIFSNYEIHEGDKVYSEIKVIEEAVKKQEVSSVLKEIIYDVKDNPVDNEVEVEIKEIKASEPKPQEEAAYDLAPKDKLNKHAEEIIKVNNLAEHLEKEGNEIEVYINQEKYNLTGKNSYVFVDVFNYINFDLSISKGMLNLLLNGNKASFYDKLASGDKITIDWC